MYELPEKVIKKFNEELIDIHKKCITNYLIQRQIKITRRRQLFIIYDHYISHKNIRMFFYRPIKLFVYALVTNRLEEISNYIYKTKKKCSLI